MTRFFFTAVLLLLTAARAFPQTVVKDSPDVLTLTAAIAEAQQNNRLIKISNLGVLYANDAILAAKTQRYPQFNVQLIGSGLLTAINVNIPQGSFGTINNTPVPSKNAVISTGQKFSALAFIQAYQPLTQLVLFDFIEEMHEKGEPLEQALLDAGIVRLRPVMITLGAMILALFPLAIHGGPLWQPLCYAQIGGLGVATFITLLLVPVLYSIFVLDLKIVTGGKVEAPSAEKLTLNPKGELP
jgi:AcrB/AcrD/AcrF family